MHVCRSQQYIYNLWSSLCKISPTTHTALFQGARSDCNMTHKWWKWLECDTCLNNMTIWHVNDGSGCSVTHAWTSQTFVNSCCCVCCSNCQWTNYFETPEYNQAARFAMMTSLKYCSHHCPTTETLKHSSHCPTTDRVEFWTFFTFVVIKGLVQAQSCRIGPIHFLARWC